MAVISTSATASAFLPNFRASPRQHGGQFSNSISIALKPRRFWIRSSGDVPMETMDEADSISPVESPKGPPSLISALNVEKVLRGIGNTENRMNLTLLFFFVFPRLRIFKRTLIRIQFLIWVPATTAFDWWIWIWKFQISLSMIVHLIDEVSP